MEPTYWRDRHLQSLAMARKSPSAHGRLAQLELARLYGLMAGARRPSQAPEEHPAGRATLSLRSPA